MTTVTLSQDQLRELAQMIAAELARSASSAPSLFGRAKLTNEAAGLADVRTTAARLGVSEWFVREHADELGVIRVGSGSKKRLRFDLDAAVSRYGGEGPQAAKPRTSGRLAPAGGGRSGRRPIVGRNEGHVLQARGDRSGR